VTAAVAAAARFGLGRAAAVLALTSAAVHLLVLDGSALGSLVMAVMALACLPCAWHLWRAPTAATWGLTAALDAGMLALHAQLMAAPSSGHDTGHSPGRLMWLGVCLLALQLAVAALAGWRGREQPGAGDRSDDAQLDVHVRGVGVGHRDDQVEGHLLEVLDAVGLGGADTRHVDHPVVALADRGRGVVGHPSS
jgi:hypothetical protein